MIIRNITSGQNREIIIITSLKEKREDDDFSIQPGGFLDTEAYAVPDRKVEKSSELKQLMKPTKEFPQGKIKVTRSLEEDKKENVNLLEASMKEQRQAVLDRIASTNGLTELEDYIVNSKDAQIVKEAKDRLRELTGSEEIDNPELKDRNTLL